MIYTLLFRDIRPIPTRSLRLTFPTAMTRRIPARHRARIVLVAFIFTFIASRILVFLIMAHRIPVVYLHLRGTHIHHLNYGIFLLSGVGAFLLFTSPSQRNLARASLLYGIGLALTFDEFGMWLHLGGFYWQRASFDAVVVLIALLGLVGFAPPIQKWRPRDMATGALTVASALAFYLLLAESFKFATRFQPRFEQLEEHAPPA